MCLMTGIALLRAVSGQMDALGIQITQQDLRRQVVDFMLSHVQDLTSRFQFYGRG